MQAEITVCSDIFSFFFFFISQHYILEFHATVAHLCYWTRWACLHSPTCITEPWEPMTLPLVVLHSTYLNGYNALHTRKAPQDLLSWRRFGPLVQPSQFDLQILTLVHFFCFQHSNLEHCLKSDNHCNSLHFSVVLIS